MKLFLFTIMNTFIVALKPTSNLTIPVAWIAEPATDSQFNYELIIFAFQGMELHDDVT